MILDVTSTSYPFLASGIKYVSGMILKLTRKVKFKHHLHGAVYLLSESRVRQVIKSIKPVVWFTLVRAYNK